ncbi:hypothetical protein BKA64DRAFT_707342 [Cadophora sp. MPI-SDFR-AT-0126]|nr:hypothetical protein BKA64DRAFT_707342 [Leotiomycetes sp. MPI-SDFR-AT-0126]
MTTTTITSAVPIKRGGAAATCLIKNFPVLKPFACDVIRAACLLFLKPVTTTKTTTIPGSTSTIETTLATPTVTEVTTSTVAPGPVCNSGTFSDPPNIGELNCNCDYEIRCNSRVAQNADRIDFQNDYTACATECDTFSDCAFFNVNQSTSSCSLYAGSLGSTAEQQGFVIGIRATNTCRLDPVGVPMLLIVPYQYRSYWLFLPFRSFCRCIVN